MDLLELHTQGTIGIVSRRVPRSPDVIDLVVAAGPEALPRFRPLPPELRSWGWRAELRLPWHRPCIVSVELTAWSATTTELRLAPVSAHVLRWSDRRWDRYFGLAHAAADQVIAALCTTPTGMPDAPPVAPSSRW